MKRFTVPVCLLMIALFLSAQYSVAGIGAGCGGGCKGKNSQAQQPLNAETKKKYEQFMLKTADLQKEMRKKVTQYQALLSSENPDPSKAAMLTEEYFQLRTVVEEEAMKAGLVQRQGGCNGCNGGPGVACGRPGSTASVEKTN